MLSAVALATRLRVKLLVDSCFVCLYSFMRSHVVHTQERTAVVSGLSGAVPAFYIEPWDGSYWGHVNCVINCFVTQTFKPRFTCCEHASVTGRRSSVASSRNALTCFYFVRDARSCRLVSTTVHMSNSIRSFVASSSYLFASTHASESATCIDVMFVPGRRSSVASRHCMSIRLSYRQVATSLCLRALHAASAC